ATPTRLRADVRPATAGLPTLEPPATMPTRAAPSSVGGQTGAAQANALVNKPAQGSTWDHSQPVQHTNLSQMDAHPPQEQSWGPAGNALQPGYLGGMQGQTLPQPAQRWSSGLTIPLQI